MQIQNNAWIFQNNTTTTGNGNILYPNNNDQITVFTTGNSTSRTIHFEGSDNDGNFYPIPAVKLPELTIASSTTSINEVWVINSSHWVSIRCRVSAINGGTVKIIGKVVNSGINLITSTITGSIPEGEALIGKIGIDQTTPGTTNGIVNKDSSGTEIFTAENPAMVQVDGMGQVDTTAVTNPDQVTANQLGLLRGILKSGNAILKDLATGGMPGKIIDNTKNFETDMFAGKIAKITVSGITYYRNILNNNATEIILSTPLEAPEQASVVIGDVSAGQITIIVDEYGSDGNNYTVQFIESPGADDNPSAGLDGTALTVYLGMTGGVLDDAKNTATQITDVINQVGGFTVTMTGAGGPMGVTEIIPFEGGSDGISVEAGIPYEVLNQ